MGVVTSISIADDGLVTSFSSPCTVELNSGRSVGERVVLTPSSDELWEGTLEEKCSFVSDVVIDWMIVEPVTENVSSVTTPED
jgi:hypothetical protein